MRQHQNTEMNTVLVEKKDAISEENPSKSGETEMEDDLLELPRRDYSEIKAERALAKRFDTLFHKVEEISRSLDLGSNAEAPTIMADSITTHFDSSPSYIVNGQLRDYQLQGLNWLISLHEHGVGGLLADEMGLGKTIQVIALFGYLKHYRETIPARQHLVIVPLSTVGNWKNEFEKWCPTLRVLVFHGNKPERRYLAQRLRKECFDVCISTYEIVTLEKSTFMKLKWCYLVIDEGGRIKDEKRQLSNIVRRINSINRLLMTGIPLQNNLHELWALLNFLIPNVFNSSEDFDAWFNVEDFLENTSLVLRLHNILRPFYLRRLKSDVEKAIPPKKEIKIYISLTKIERERYTKLCLTHKCINNLMPYDSRSKSPLNILLEFRKCCNHPYLFSDFEPDPPFITDMNLVNRSGKMRVLDKLLFFLRDQGSRILLFSQFTIMLDIIEDYMCWRKFPYCRLDGNTTHEDREQGIYNFNKPGSKKFVFLLSTRAGALGINLTTADVVIFYDSDYNPHWDLQAMDRAHRIGQTKTVRVFRLIAENTVEERLLEIAEAKLRLENTVFEEVHRMDSSKISRDEIISVIRYGADHISASQDSEIADEDIEIIIEKSEKKTQEKHTKLESMGESALSFLCQASDDYQESMEDAGKDNLIHHSKRNGTANSDNDTSSRNLQLESIEESTLENFSFDAPEDFQECQKDAEIEHLIQLSKRKHTATSDANPNYINYQLESIGDNPLKSFSSNAFEDDQDCQEDAENEHLVQLFKRKSTPISDVDPNSINHQLELIGDSTLKSYSYTAPEDDQECQKDAGNEHLVQLPKRKRKATSDIDRNSKKLQLESIEDNTLKNFSFNAPEDYSETHKDVGSENLFQLPKRKRTASFGIDPKCSDLMASKAKTLDHKLKQKTLKIQKHKEPKSLKIHSKQKSKRIKRDKLLKSIQTCENVCVSTNNDKDLNTFSTLRNISMNHLKKVVQTAIQFQRHSHSRRLCASHFSKALAAHGFHFESDFLEDFQDYCTSVKQRGHHHSI